MKGPAPAIGNAETLRVQAGSAPLVVSCPHAGTELPAELAERMSDEGRAVPDTDWFVDRLWDFCRGLGATMLVPRFSRYVVDLNRPPDDAPLYPGSTGTGLVPQISFAGASLYREAAPDVTEQAARVATYWQPYHDELAAQLERLRQCHANVVLIEAHSIASRVPMLFDGRLPDINVGSADGASAGAELLGRIERRLASQDTFSWVSNGRFKGGYITRHYGQPANGIDAIQFEIAQCAYMDEVEACWSDAKSARLVPLLQGIVREALDHASRLATIQGVAAGRG